MAIDSHGELLKVVDDLNTLVERGRQEDITGSLARLKDACLEIGKVWSRSCLGYHARVYRNNFQPTSGDLFSFDSPFDSYRGLTPSFLYGPESWVEYDQETIQKAILERAGNLDLKSVYVFQDEADKAFNDHKQAVLSIIDIETIDTPSSFLETMKNSALKLAAKSISDLNNEAFARIKVPATQDRRALAEGRQLPIHWRFMNYVLSVNSLLESIPNLSEVAAQSAKHIARQRPHRRQESIGSKVFIGHGRSSVWRELKGFLEDRLGLQCEEFNRVPVAGLSNKERLLGMLNEASIAFLIMTGEDEQPDGKFSPRMNVVHEAGLFQGRLGFERGIILLEEGCEDFSNIDGLGQIRFPKGSIKYAFEEVRRVCEREGLC